MLISKFHKFVFATLFILIGFIGVGIAATEGVDYIVLDTPLPNQEGTLIKIFSYDCPFCYKYDKSVTPKVVAKLKGKIDFVPWHLDSKAKYGKEGNRLFAALLTKDAKAGKNIFDDDSSFKKAKFAYYSAYHDKKQRWDSGPKAFLKTGMDAAGITQAEFDVLLKNPMTVQTLKTWEDAFSIAKLQGVPAFIVDGKYLIYTKSIRSIDGMADLILELSK